MRLTHIVNYQLNLYQIQSKFRDERRPRYGLMRSREFHYERCIFFLM